MPPSRPRHRTLSQLRDYALAFPEAREDFPWGERVVKVRDKVFAMRRPRSWRSAS